MKKKFKSINDHPGLRPWYHGLVMKAYTAEAERLKGDLPPREEWRHQINMKATKKYSIKEMNQSSDFDAVMLELAIIAGDDKQINKFIAGNERRLRHVIRWFIYDLEYLKKERVTWAYIKGICKQAGYSDSLMDCPEEHLANVMMMVDNHVRKLASEQKIARADLPSGYMRKGYSDDEAKARFRHDHHHHITHGEAA